MAVAVTITGIAAVNSAETNAPAPDPQIKAKNRKTSSAAAGAVLPCPGARKAVTYYRAAYARQRAIQRLPGPVPYVRYGCPATQRRAIEWRDRATIERYAAAAWVDYHYNWRSWLPSNWQALGACETGYGRRPGNFNHANSGFVSAFGITRRNYSVDARASGTPQWDDRQPPTPRQQFLAALAHYRMYGDGWTCPGP